MNKQKGAASIFGIVLLILVIGGIGYLALRNGGRDENPAPTINIPVENNEDDEENNPSALTPNQNLEDNVPVVIPVQTGAGVYEIPYGLAFRLPENWQNYNVVRSSPSFGGNPASDSFTIQISGESLVTINVFTKEQWNRIRTQENAANQNVNSLGEGEYLGENSTYIYSYTIHNRESEVRVLLNSIIKF